MKIITKLIKQALLTLIRLYQRTLSPDHGVFSHKHPYGYCRFRPTCSQYAYEAIERHGVVRGGYKAAKRIIKCNPFNRGGYDPVSEI